MTRSLPFLATVLALALPAAAMAQAKPRVALETSLGKIVLELDAAKAPKTVANFVAYVKAKQYDGTIFHRVIPGFMAQAGGFTPDMKEKATKPPIQNEASNGLKNDRGTIAMARTQDPNSATAQFFINVANNNRSLDYSDQNPGYAVFGTVVEGMDVVDKIVQVKTTTKGTNGDVPVEPILIKKATLEKAPAAAKAAAKKPAPKKPA
jgi:peptidyl-prolyl cis-trans isomerase A (cyclophilin A)